MKIFYGEKEVDYSKSNGYAFLNWRFDTPMNEVKQINENYEMGKAYISNAILTLHSILHCENTCSISDILIFPVLFETWHGIELWLKSGIQALHIIKKTASLPSKPNHDISNYLNILRETLDNLDMRETQQIALTEIISLIEELSRVNAHFDFARYSLDNKNNYQFYNIPVNDSKQWQENLESCKSKRVPNTCVDLNALWEMLLRIAGNFRLLIEFLATIACENEELSDEMLTDKNYIIYLKKYRRKDLEEQKYTLINNEMDPIKQIMELIKLYIL